MRRRTIRGGLGLVALAAFGLFTVRDGSLLWAQVIVYSTAALFAAALILAVLRRGRDAALIGFVLVGGGYWAAGLFFGAAVPPFAWEAGRLDELAALIHERVEPSPPLFPDVMLDRAAWEKLDEATRRDMQLRTALFPERQRRYDHGLVLRVAETRRIGHAWLALALGVAGAFSFGYLLDRRPARGGREGSPS